MAVRHRHFWVLRDNYFQCGICGKIKVGNEVFDDLYSFVLKFLQEIFARR
jgi:hypothetical protein